MAERSREPGDEGEETPVTEPQVSYLEGLGLTTIGRIITDRRATLEPDEHQPETS